MLLKNVAVLSTDDVLNHSILDFCLELGDEFTPIYLRDKNKIIQFLKYELPEINIFNCTDRYIMIEEILNEIRKDPWLHYGSIIVVHDQEDEKELLAMFKDVNILSLIRRGEFELYFPRLLRILSKNRAILFQRDIHSLLKMNLSGSFDMSNDPFDLTTYSNLLANFLYNANLLNHEEKESFHVALMELLINAIEHGNCSISYNEKTEWQRAGKDVLDLIKEKNKDSKIAKKKVYLRYRISPQKSTFAIRDEGKGFEWRSFKVITGEDGLEETHGRGIAIAKHFVSNLLYNDKGNEVRFEIEHSPKESNVVPEAFTDMEEVCFEDGDKVFTQGEKSSHLYYIVSGTYEVYVDNKQVGVLTPDDIFLGEMSFLLNNKRSATVCSVGRGGLIKISKEAFINAIKENPHYGIFLARLLSQRLVRLNKIAGL